jgi:hypothetical protein
MIFSAGPTVEVNYLELIHAVLTSGKALAARAFWTGDAEAPASSDASAPCYSRAKDVCVLAVVVAKLKFGQIKRQILFADVMIGSDDATLEQAPEVFQIVCVDFAAHVLACTMADRFMVVAERFEIAIAAVFVGRDQINLIADGLAHEAIERSRIGVLNDLADHVALTGNRADNADLAGADAASDVAFPVPVAVLILSAKERLVHFDDTHKLTEIGIVHRRAQAMAHVPSGAICLASDLPLNLESADALLGIEHLPEHFKPSLQRIFSVIENRSDRYGKAIGLARLVAAHATGPMKGLELQGVDLGVAAARAPHAIRPAALHEELLAGIVGREGHHQFTQGHHV